MTTIADLCQRAFTTAAAKGFHVYTPRFGVPGQDVRHILSWLMLITTEVAEAAEAARIGDRENFAEECADIFIRLGNVCAALGIDLEAEVLKKMARNDARPALHGGKLA